MTKLTVKTKPRTNLILALISYSLLFGFFDSLTLCLGLSYSAWGFLGCFVSVCFDRHGEDMVICLL
jgi:hypothetical protein